MTASSAPFRFLFRVPYAPCTVGNHVYYSRYLEFIESARNELFRAIGQPCRHWQEQGVIFPVVECRLQYKAPARYDDLLTIELWVRELTRVRIAFGYRILDEAGRLLVEGETQHVCTTVAEKPRRTPEELLRALQPYLAGVGSPAPGPVAAP